MHRFLSAALLFTTLAASAQETQFGERVDVDVVLIDALVTDSKGNHILGLDKEDFVVREDGVEQTIESVDYFTNRRLLNAREKQAPFRVERVREDRYFIFFFDKPPENSFFDRLAIARRAVKEFIDDRMLDTDHVAIVGHDVRLKVYSDFTTDKKKLRDALKEVARFGPALTKEPAGEAPSILRNVDRNDMIGGTGTVYQALETLANSLRPIRARKNLVVFSAGIYEPGEEVRGGLLLNTSRYYEPTVRALNAANVAFYGMQLLNEAGMSPLFHQTLQRLSDETSGEYFRFPMQFTREISTVDRNNAGYYLLTYTTKKPRGTKGYQKVDVSLKTRELRLKAREGYMYGPDSSSR